MLVYFLLSVFIAWIVNSHSTIIVQKYIETIKSNLKQLIINTFFLYIFIEANSTILLHNRFLNTVLISR